MREPEPLAFLLALLFDLAGLAVRVPRDAVAFRLLFAAVDDLDLVGIIPPGSLAKTADYISERGTNDKRCSGQTDGGR